MPATPSPRLLGDLGGTNLRLAWQAVEGAPLEDVLSLSCDEHAGPAQAIRAYLQRTGRPAPAACAIGVAAPIIGDRVQLTNRMDWSFSISGLQRELGIPTCVIDARTPPALIGGAHALSARA